MLLTICPLWQKWNTYIFISKQSGVFSKTRMHDTSFICESFQCCLTALSVWRGIWMEFSLSIWWECATAEFFAIDTCLAFLDFHPANVLSAEDIDNKHHHFHKLIQLCSIFCFNLHILPSKNGICIYEAAFRFSICDTCIMDWQIN